MDLQECLAHIDVYEKAEIKAMEAKEYRLKLDNFLARREEEIISAAYKDSAITGKNQGERDAQINDLINSNPEVETLRAHITDARIKEGMLEVEANAALEYVRMVRAWLYSTGPQL